METAIGVFRAKTSNALTEDPDSRSVVKGPALVNADGPEFAQAACTLHELAKVI